MTIPSLTSRSVAHPTTILPFQPKPPTFFTSWISGILIAHVGSLGILWTTSSPSRCVVKYTHGLAGRDREAGKIELSIYTAPLRPLKRPLNSTGPSTSALLSSFLEGKIPSFCFAWADPTFARTSSTESLVSTPAAVVCLKTERILAPMPPFFFGFCVSVLVVDSVLDGSS